MATANGRPGYKVSVLPSAREKLRAFRDQAVLRGLEPAFRLDMQGVERRLEHDPFDWGDPQFDYHHLGMTRRRGRAAFLYVYYAVHEQGRAVFIRDFDLNPHGPLGGPPG